MVEAKRRVEELQRRHAADTKTAVTWAQKNAAAQAEVNHESTLSFMLLLLCVSLSEKRVYVTICAPCPFP